MIFILPETSLRKETAVAFFFRQPLFALTLQALWIGTYCSNDVKKWNKKKLDTSGRIEAANPNTWLGQELDQDREERYSAFSCLSAVFNPKATQLGKLGTGKDV